MEEEEIIIHFEEEFCGCCGRLTIVGEDWCGECALHLVQAESIWDRTFFAQTGCLCPFSIDWR